MANINVGEEVQVSVKLDAGVVAEKYAKKYSEDAEAWAKGTRNGVNVTSDDETYQKHSKYFAIQSGQLAYNSAQSANQASVYANNANSSATAASTTLTQTREARDDAVSAKNLAESYRDQSWTAKENAYESEGNAEAWAKGTRHGEAVPSSDETYQHNAYYYSGIANAGAEDAEQARDRAEYFMILASQKADDASQSASRASSSENMAIAYAGSASRASSQAESAKNAILNMTVEAESLPEGSSATVVYADGHMAFGIPKGDTGETGATPQMSIGTVETLAPDEDATATITGTAENPVLSLGIPKGETGEVSKAELASLMPLETVSGSVASFSDGSAVFDAESALVTLEPIQDLHGYDKPWAAGAGKNKLDDSNPVSLLNCTYVDGVLTATKTSALTNFNPVLQAWNGSSYVGAIGTRTGTSYAFTKSSTFNRMSFGHGDTSTDVKIWFDASNLTDDVDYIFSWEMINSSTPFKWKNMMVRLSSVSDATFAPYSNICPISGHTECVTEVCGKNLFDKNNVFVGYIDDNDGSINPSAPYKCTDFIKVSPNESYYVKSEQTNGIWGAWYDAEKNCVSGLTGYANAVVTAPNNAYYVRLTILTDRSGNIDTFAVNYPSTDHEYHAYQGQTYTTSLGRTVYGGTVDLVSGVLTVEAVKITENDIVSLSLGGTSDANRKRAYIQLREQPKLIDSRVIGNIKCNVFPSKTANETYLKTEGISYAGTATGVYAYKEELQTIADWNSFISDNGMEFTCELATPQTIQLTPQAIALLTGDNNVWSDGGSIEVKYRANIGLYVDKKISEVNA